MRYFVTFLFSFFALCTTAQQINREYVDLGFELQVYPTGIIPGLDVSYFYNSVHEMEFRFGYNFIRHGDLGVHMDERGDGWGFSFGYLRYFKEKHKGFSLGLRNDIWFNTIKWRDNLPNEVIASDVSHVTVLQPTVVLSRVFCLARMRFEPTLAFGYEWNVKTEGAPTGQGSILLVGFKIGLREIKKGIFD